MKRTMLVTVGACAIDTILTVPHYPGEDEKLRATSLTKRRGGNTANTLEVLQQITPFKDRADDESSDTRGQSTTTEASSGLELYLIATLPARECVQTAFIASSFEHSNASAKVSLEYCIYREQATEPVSSYIVSGESTSSRTIINHNALPEMDLQEFENLTRELLRPTTLDIVDVLWFHFEGRIPETTRSCIAYLRNRFVFRSSGYSVLNHIDLKISVELEKPHREGLQQLALLADVVFCSKSWAQAEGYQDPQTCLRAQAKVLEASRDRYFARDRLLVCAWGNLGACALSLPSRPKYQDLKSSLSYEVVHSPAFISDEKPIVDTTGAGDTFIAGMLFGLICRGRTQDRSHTTRARVWSLDQMLRFANGLAGRKILQHGFRGLGDLSKDIVYAEDQRR